MHDQSALKAGRAGRSLAALALVATLLPWATIPPPARAEHEAGHEPVARLQLFLKEVYIYDDHDPGWFLGAGELHLNLTFPARRAPALVQRQRREHRPAGSTRSPQPPRELRPRRVTGDGLPGVRRRDAGHVLLH